MSEREDDFLGRWSRRKAEARGGGLKKKPDAQELPVNKPGRMRTDPLPAKTELATAEEAPDGDTALIQEAALREDLNEDQVPAPVENDEAPAEDRDETEDSAEAEPEDFEKIDFDSLNYDSDYTKFMKSGVPESVRKRALRMLWGSNPILANVDGLNDYDDDFTDAALAVKGLLKTSYNAKTGYLTDEEREASYSEEARKAGVEPEDEAQASDKVAGEAVEDEEKDDDQVVEASASDDETTEDPNDGEATAELSEDSSRPGIDDASGKADDTA